MSTSIEWLNHNAYRHYPLRDDAKLDLLAGSELPLSVLLDFHAVTLEGETIPVVDENPVTRVAALREAYIAKRRSAGPITFVEIQAGDPHVLVFSYAGVAFTVEVPANASFPYRVEVLTSKVHAEVVVGEGLNLLAPGTYTLAVPAEIQPALVIDQSNHRVNAMRATGPVLTGGPVYVEAGYNCEVTVTENPSRVRILAGRSLGKGVSCSPLTETPVITCRDVFFFITGQAANYNGNLPITGGAGVEVTAGSIVYEGESVPAVIIKQRSQNSLVDCQPPDTP